MCSFLFMCIYLSVAATVLTLIAITIHRFYVVILPNKKRIKTSQLPKVSLACVIVQGAKDGDGFARDGCYSDDVAILTTFSKNKNIIRYALTE